MLRLSRRALLGCLAFAASAATASGAEPAASAAQRVALKGYDPVSYFDPGRPEQGSPAFRASFDGTTYQFVSAAHRDTFIADPDRYAPQYDGFCAITLARGQKAEPDPEAFTISGGKLYVFASRPGLSVFRNDAANMIDKASRNFAALR